MSSLDLGTSSTDFGYAINFQLPSTATYIRKLDLGLIYLPRLEVSHTGSGTDPELRAELYKNNSPPSTTLLTSSRISESEWVTIPEPSTGTNFSCIFNMINSRTEKDIDSSPSTAPLPLDNRGVLINPTYTLLIRFKDTTFTNPNYVKFPVQQATDPTSTFIEENSINDTLNLNYTDFLSVEYTGSTSGVNDDYNLSSISATYTPDFHIITSDVINSTYLSEIPTYNSEGKVTNYGREILPYLLEDLIKIEFKGYSLGSSGYLSTYNCKPMEVDQDATELIASKYPEREYINDPFKTMDKALLPITSISYPTDGVLSVNCNLEANNYKTNFGEIGIWSEIKEIDPSITLPSTLKIGDVFLFGVSHTPMLTKNEHNLFNLKVILNF